MKARSYDAEATAAPSGALSSFAYNAKLAGEIESRWQHRWAEDGTFHSPNPVGPLSAGFDEVKGRANFSSWTCSLTRAGTGLHVGHPLGYIGTDVCARYQRMTGNVLHTMGYDAFGLPAEQYAVETGQHPRSPPRPTSSICAGSCGGSGWATTRRAIATTDPGYYRWTQWIFLQIFNSWYDAGAPGRPADQRAGRRARVGQRPVPDGRAWDGAAAVERREVVDGYRLAYISTETRSTGARAWARCSPTRRSPPTAGASAATSRSTTAAAPMDAADHRVRRPAARRPGPAGLARGDQATCSATGSAGARGPGVDRWPRPRITSRPVLTVFTTRAGHAGRRN